MYFKAANYFIHFSFNVISISEHPLLRFPNDHYVSKDLIEVELVLIEAAIQRCSVKMVFLKIHKIHRKTPVPESLF